MVAGIRKKYLAIGYLILILNSRDLSLNADALHRAGFNTQAASGTVVVGFQFRVGFFIDIQPDFGVMDAVEGARQATGCAGHADLVVENCNSFCHVKPPFPGFDPIAVLRWLRAGECRCFRPSQSFSNAVSSWLRSARLCL